MNIYDDTTGLYYLNSRYYNPEDGRFITEDTYTGEYSEPSSLHLYAYCQNNPVNNTDPTGNFPWAIVSAAWDAYDGANNHFNKHAKEIMDTLGKNSYNLKEYIDDANYIIKNGQYTPELNGYVKFMEEKVMQNMVS